MNIGDSSLQYNLCDTGAVPVGLLTQLVDHCIGIAEVMGSNPIQI